MKRGRKSTFDKGKILSDREEEILRLLTVGLKYIEIGRELYISPETVRTHAHKIYTKLGARNRI